MNRRDLLVVSATAAVAGSAPAQSAAWKPQAFDAHQNETVVVLTELIIPATDTGGAKAAQVNRYMDQLLDEGPTSERDRFLEGLGVLDACAIGKYQKPFVNCAAGEQTTILQTFDKNEDPGAASGFRFFHMAKQLTSRVSYSTEIGFTERNKGGRVPATFACHHSEHKGSA